MRKYPFQCHKCNGNTEFVGDKLISGKYYKVKRRCFGCGTKITDTYLFRKTKEGEE